ncbi:MAG: hypothetical protein RL512_378 [Bacteroidota bacterium]
MARQSSAKAPTAVRIRSGPLNPAKAGFFFDFIDSVDLTLQSMLTEQDKAFIDFWDKNREAKKRWVRQLSVGLPLGVSLVLATVASLFSGWYGRAQMVLFREQSSLILVLVFAAIAIVLFIVIFSARHQWDMNEQRYQELINRQSF